MRRAVKNLALLLIPCLLLFAGNLWASTLYISFSGQDAHGTIDTSGSDSDFSDVPWLLEFGVNDQTPDSAPSDAQSGLFLDSIIEGHINIDGTTFELAGSSITGNVSLHDYVSHGGSENIQINPDSGGYMQWVTGNTTTFPALFTDVNDLTSAVEGASITDSTTDYANNSCIISFNNSTKLTTASSGTISIYEYAGPASESFTASVSYTSKFPANPIPEPATMLLLGVGLIGLTGFGRKKFLKK